MRPLRRKLKQQAIAVLAPLPHSDYAATADRDARLFNPLEGPNAVVVCSRRDYLSVELGRRVEVVIVSRQSGFGERVRLVVVEHSQRAADLHAEPAHLANHLENA